MREIKFKFLLEESDGRNTLTEAYDFVDLIAPDGYVDVVCEYSAERILEQLQWTGLLDKEGVEIYEGDIVRVIAGNSHEGTYELDKILVVQYCGAGFDMIDNDDVGYGWGLAFGCEEVEVIGNIYENPELLDKA